MENLRSALDFTAHGLFDKYGTSPGPSKDIYLPYARLNQSEEQFRRSGRIDKCIPGLSASRPDIAARLESYQHFAAPENRWLPIFMDLNNQNKHQHLTPQVRKQKKELGLSSGGVSIRMGPGASISLKPGSLFRLGDTVINGGRDINANRPPTGWRKKTRIEDAERGQSIDVYRPPKATGTERIEVITWVSFHFSANDEPVLPLLRQAHEGVDRIVRELSAV